MHNSDLSLRIRAWYDVHRRDLPWRGTTDAYRIWLSEIILQQTRVAQGLDYYRRFLDAYPTVAALAAATEDEVLALWQGLGYYSRARHLHAAARQVMEHYGGTFPTRSDQLLRLSGVGAYTAAAVASFAAGEDVAVVDDNVYRVLARLFDVTEPIDTGRGVRLFQQLADELLPHGDSARHNQAMMELGALCCTPASPDCAHCPVADACLARAAGTVDQRPLKAGRTRVLPRRLVYFLFKYNNVLWGRRRPAGDIWQGLYEYVSVDVSQAALDEAAPRAGASPQVQATPLPSPQPDASAATGGDTAPDALLRALLPEDELALVRTVRPLALGRRQRLTHRLLTVDCWMVEVAGEVHPAGGFLPFTWEEWSEKAVPKLISEINVQVSDLF